MAYTPPTRAQFIIAFPTFLAVSDPTYALWSDEAVTITEPLTDCLGTRMGMATMLLTAHLLTLAGVGSGAESEMAAQGMSGFKSIKSGSLSLERGDSASAAKGEYASTSFGQRVWPMLSACLVGPRVTATGAVPCSPYPRGW